MIEYEHLRPKFRSELRVFLGRKYYTCKRWIEWFFGGYIFAEKSDERLKPMVFTHKTPLYRKLKNVDMVLQYNKVENLKIALKKIDGVLIKPGETFSYWKSIGKPTAAKGYKDGMVLYYGKYKTGTGGGLCQLSNLIYWMVLHSPLTVTERHRHSFDVFPDLNRTQPFGSGATCVYNYRDLQVKNETEEMYQIDIKIEGDYLVGEIRSSSLKYLTYELYEKEHEITHEYWGGYIRHNKIFRKILNMNEEIIDDRIVCENHALMMYSPMLENE